MNTVTNYSAGNTHTVTTSLPSSLTSPTVGYFLISRMTDNCPFSIGAWKEGKLGLAVKGSVPSSILRLFPHKLSTRPPCGAVLIGGMQITWIWFQHSNERSLLPRIAADNLFASTNMHRYLFWRLLYRTDQSFPRLLSFRSWRKHGAHCLGFHAEHRDVLLFWSPL